MFRVFSLATVFMLLLLNSCARRSISPIEAPAHPLYQEQYADLTTLAGQLNGSYRHDLARLQLREDLLAEPRYLENGCWLLHLEGEQGQSLHCFRPAEDSEKVQPLLLAHADSLALLEVRHSDSHYWPWQLLLREEQKGQVELLQVSPDGRRRSLVQEAAGRIFILQNPLRVRVPQRKAKSVFVESPGSMHLEVDVPLEEHRDGWVTGEPVEVENSYRCLNSFLSAVRRGKWSRAERHADLHLLLALPEGGHSPRLAASMKLSEPELLSRKLALCSPAYGPLRRFSSVDGRFTWHVEFRREPDRDGEMRYLLTRLERVEG